MRDYSPFGGKAGSDSTPATNMQLRSKCTAWPLQNQALKMQRCKSASQYESTIQPQSYSLYWKKFHCTSGSSGLLQSSNIRPHAMWTMIETVMTVIFILITKSILSAETDYSDSHSDNCVEDLFTVPTRQSVNLFQEVRTPGGGYYLFQIYPKGLTKITNQWITTCSQF